jgi:hypothetical protein
MFRQSTRRTLRKNHRLINSFYFQILERTEALQLGLGDPADEEVLKRTLYMINKQNAVR